MRASQLPRYYFHQFAGTIPLPPHFLTTSGARDPTRCLLICRPTPNSRTCSTRYKIRSSSCHEERGLDRERSDDKARPARSFLSNQWPQKHRNPFPTVWPASNGVPASGLSNPPAPTFSNNHRFAFSGVGSAANSFPRLRRSLLFLRPNYKSRQHCIELTQ